MPKVSKYRHEWLTFERESVLVKLWGRRGRVEDVFVGNLVGEEGDMEGREEAGDELVFFF